MTELLSPAGSMEALKAAVAAGADAVYLGGRAFNARASAANFDKEGMIEAVRYCHIRGVKVNVTFNTLLKENEFDEAVCFARELGEAGADALITQDIGLARELFRLCPGIPLHASTQMAVANAEGVQEMRDLGFKRVVLARELSISDIADIRARTDTELECFIHGALCVAMSGKCLFSSLIGARSGNRGQCAQPCRLPYTLLQGGRELASGHLLSTKDLCTLPYLGEIVSLGVASLKIEGRLKRPEYVYIVTSQYRRALDMALEGRATDDPRSMEELMGIFNRGGFTQGYYHGVCDTLFTNPADPANSGVNVGRITSPGQLLACVPLSAGDSLELRAPGREAVGLELTREYAAGVEGRIDNDTAPAGAQAYRVRSVEQIRRADEGIARQRLVPLDMEAEVFPGRHAKLTLRAGDVCVSAQSADEAQQARSRELSEADITERLTKLGGTDFCAGEVFVRTAGAFMPVSALNTLRRDALWRMQDALLAKADPMWRVGEQSPSMPRTADMAAASPELWAQGGLEECMGAVKGGADGVYYRAESFAEPLNGEALRALSRGGAKVFVALPALLRHEDMKLAIKRIEECKGQLDGILTSDMGALRYFRKKLCVHMDYTANAANCQSVTALLQMGARRVSLSCELNTRGASDACAGLGGAAEIVVQGRLTLMSLAHCPVRAAKGESTCAECGRTGYALRDRKGYIFPLRACRMTRCTQDVLNAVELVSADMLASLPKCAAYRVILTEGENAAERTVGIYKNALAGAQIKSEDMSYLTRGGFTRGHFNRGI